jgi:large subunit ribosomal protein L31
MKQDTHPSYHPVCFVDVSTGRRFLTRSTLKSKQTEVIDGVEHHMVVRDVTMDSHPAYTGEKRFVDTAGRVEKFQNKFRRGRRRG